MTDRAVDGIRAGATGSVTAARSDRDLGGDPACWLNRVCDSCGRFVDDPLAEICPVCGARRDA